VDMSDDVEGDSGVKSDDGVWGCACNDEERGGEDKGEELRLLTFTGGLDAGLCDLVRGARTVMVIYTLSSGPVGLS
jgi:hypothetical protein